jgi:hypothetical protein
MTNKRIKGATGLSVLSIEPASPPKPKRTAPEMAKWAASLPVADTGVAAKKFFIQLDELNNTEMTARERFAVMEELRASNKTICTALKRHYIEQRAPLTEHKLIIANLRQTLLIAMSDSYKLILEDLHAKNGQTEEDKKLMATTIVRILYYLNVLLIARYQLYSFPPDNVWLEIHLLYKYAKARGLLNIHVHCQFASKRKETSVMEAYTRAIMMYAIDPYQWRQREQHSLNKAIEMWALYPTIYEHDQIPNLEAGLYIIDLDKDAPPALYGFKESTITPSTIALDLTKCVEHLKDILSKMQTNHLKAKIENPNDPEFSVTAPTIAKLIKIWSQKVVRGSPRYPIQAQIKIAFGLTAAHYYLNDEKEFNPHPSNLQSEIGDTAKRGSTLSLPLYEVSEESEEETVEVNLSEANTTELPAAKADEEEQGNDISKEQLYHIYDYGIENINPHGFCIVIKDKSYPPLQAGEIVVFKNESIVNWGVGAVRWLRRQRNEEFQIGIQILSPYAKAAGIQMLRGNKPAGRLLRCLVLPAQETEHTPPMLITTAFPQNSNTVMLYLDTAEPIKATLTKEIDASGMYYQYEYKTEAGVDIIGPNAGGDKKKDSNESGPDEEKTNTEFDSIWGDL